VPLRILLRPDPLEYGRFREQYEALAGDLEREGVLVRVLPAADVHAHAAVPPSIPLNGAENYDLLIQVGSSAGEIVGTAKLVELVRRRLRSEEGPGTRQRRAKIYLANGEEHELRFDADE
jgi:hypothetical protein